MLDARALDNLKFKQRGNACVLASLGVAAYAFTRIPVEDCFADYCKHYGMAVSDLEVYYAAHFNGEWKRLGVTGYDLIRSLYLTSAQPTFASWRAVFKLKLVGEVATDVAQVEAELKTQSVNALTVFLNNAAHSITFACDQNGLYKYDVNVGQVERLATDLNAVGQLGNGFIVTQR
jgi:hypothetical protein